MEIRMTLFTTISNIACFGITPTIWFSVNQLIIHHSLVNKCKLLDLYFNYFMFHFFQAMHRTIMGKVTVQYWKSKNTCNVHVKSVQPNCKIAKIFNLCSLHLSMLTERNQTYARSAYGEGVLTVTICGPPCLMNIHYS